MGLPALELDLIDKVTRSGPRIPGDLTFSLASIGAPSVLRSISPGGVPKKGVNKEYKVFFLMFSYFFRGTFFLKNLVWTQIWRPGT